MCSCVQECFPSRNVGSLSEILNNDQEKINHGLFTHTHSLSLSLTHTHTQTQGNPHWPSCSLAVVVNEISKITDTNLLLSLTTTTHSSSFQTDLLLLPVVRVPVNAGIHLGLHVADVGLHIRENNTREIRVKGGNII